MLSPASVAFSVLGSNRGKRQDKHGIVGSNGGKSRGKYKTRDPRLKYKDLDVDTSSNRCVCKICGKSFKALQYFRRHVCVGGVRGQAKVRDKSYCCCQCGKLFLSFSGVRGHELKHGETTQDSDGHRMMTLSKPLVQPGWRSCHCLMCGSTTTEVSQPPVGLEPVPSTTIERSQMSLTTIPSTASEIPHMGLETEAPQQDLEQVGSITTEKPDMKHLKQHLCLESYSYHNCEQHSQHKIYVKAHKKTGHKHMSCQVCGKQFQKQTDLSKHGEREHAQDMTSTIHDQQICEVKLCHPKTKTRYSCCLCGNRAFSDKTCLAVHTASAHSHEKPLICEVCGKGFKLKNGLRAHCQTHSSERPYDCQLCDKSFKFKKDLRKHQERHKSSKEHVCEVCGKCFMTRNDVYLHQRVHDPLRQHRIYRPGVYRVSCGELITARTRNNKMSLSEQEPISFDTEINTNTSMQWFKQ